jgi:hypothetical protein
MAIHLTQLNLIVTTARTAKADTDDQLELVFWANDHPDTTLLPNRWHTEALDNPWDDREWGRTDKYLVDFVRRRDVENESLIPGIAFDNFADVRNAHIFLRMRGDDQWRVADFQLLGFFYETRKGIPGFLEYPAVITHGWFLISRNTRLVVPSFPSIFDLSTDQDEGVTWFELPMNGILGCEYVPPPLSDRLKIPDDDRLAPPNG